MSMTQLDPIAALVVIDLQKGIARSPKAHPVESVLSNAAALAASFRKRGLPVVLVNVDGGAPGRTQGTFNRAGLPPDWMELVPELNAQPSDLLVTKRTWGAFTATGLDEKLRALGVTQIVLAGISTSIGVGSTARFAYELGYNMVLAADAMTDTDPEAHRVNVEKIFPRLGEVDTTENILQFLAR